MHTNIGSNNLLLVYSMEPTSDTNLLARQDPSGMFNFFLFTYTLVLIRFSTYWAV